MTSVQPCIASYNTEKKLMYTPDMHAVHNYYSSEVFAEVVD